MVKCCRSDLNSPSARLPCYLSKGPLKQHFLDIYIATSFGVCQLKKAMKVILFLKMLKIEWNLKIEKKNCENILCFWDNWIWKSCNTLPLSRKKYLLWAVNGLTNSPKTLHITQRKIFNLNCLNRDQ